LTNGFYHMWKFCCKLHDANMVLKKLFIFLQYLSLPCGLIRGALANLGIPSIVGAEITTMPMCKYIHPLFRSAIALVV
jgi:hypothetical protein